MEPLRDRSGETALTLSYLRYDFRLQWSRCVIAAESADGSDVRTWERARFNGAAA